MIKVIYARFGGIFEMHCMTIDSAKDVLHGIEDSGIGYGIGIFDDYSGVFYSPDNLHIWSKEEEAVREETLESLAEIGINPVKLEIYDRNK